MLNSHRVDLIGFEAWIYASKIRSGTKHGQTWLKKS